VERMQAGFVSLRGQGKKVILASRLDSGA